LRRLFVVGHVDARLESGCREAVERSGLSREEVGDLLAVTMFVGGCRFAPRVLQSL
jgi:hypothetical protein